MRFPPVHCRPATLLLTDFVQLAKNTTLQQSIKTRTDQSVGTGLQARAGWIETVAALAGSVAADLW